MRRRRKRTRRRSCCWQVQGAEKRPRECPQGAPEAPSSQVRLPRGPLLTAHCLLLGSLEERGLLTWNQIQEESEETTKALEVYSLPCGIGTKFCTSSCTRGLPFWPRLEHGGKGEVGVSQLTLCSQDSSGERPKGATETRM